MNPIKPKYFDTKDVKVKNCPIQVAKEETSFGLLKSSALKRCSD